MAPPSELVPHFTISTLRVKIEYHANEYPLKNLKK